MIPAKKGFASFSFIARENLLRIFSWALLKLPEAKSGEIITQTLCNSKIEK